MVIGGQVDLIDHRLVGEPRLHGGCGQLDRQGVTEGVDLPIELSHLLRFPSCPDLGWPG
jgi:hypothetical protein